MTLQAMETSRPAQMSASRCIPMSYVAWSMVFLCGISVTHAGMPVEDRHEELVKTRGLRLASIIWWNKSMISIVWRVSHEQS